MGDKDAVRISGSISHRYVLQVRLFQILDDGIIGSKGLLSRAFRFTKSTLFEICRLRMGHAFG